jgi:hypothetical protein
VRLLMPGCAGQGAPANASCTSSSCASSCTPVTSRTQPSTAACPQTGAEAGSASKRSAGLRRRPGQPACKRGSRRVSAHIWQGQGPCLRGAPQNARPAACPPTASDPGSPGPAMVMEGGWLEQTASLAPPELPPQPCCQGRLGNVKRRES